MQKRDAHLVAVWVYAALIVLLVATEPLEGGALKLFVTIAGAAIAVQSDWLRCLAKQS